MGCERFEELLWEAAEGQPSPALAEHLGKCPACQRALAALQEIQQGLAALRTVHAPEARAAVEAFPTRWPTRNIFVPAALTAGALCVIMGLVLLHPRERPKPRSPAARGRGAPPARVVVATSSAPSPREAKRERRGARAEMRLTRKQPGHRVRLAGRPRAPRTARLESPEPLMQVNPAAEISDIAVQPVVMDPAQVKPTRHYAVHSPGRTDPVKQYTVMVPGRTHPVRRYLVLGELRPGPRHEPQIVLDPTYRRMPQREVIVLSDADQLLPTMDLGEN
jgi:hypothetical protein